MLKNTLSKFQVDINTIRKVIDQRDMVRMKKADATNSAASKEARLARKLEQTAQEELF